MSSYAKIRLSSRSNGSHVGNAVLVKDDSNQFVIIGSDTLSFFSGYVGARRMTHGGLTFESASVSLTSRTLRQGDRFDSFETALVRERTMNDSLLAGFRVELVGGAIQEMPVFTTVNFDDLFAEEAREAFVSSGILIKQAYTQNETYSGMGSYHANRNAHRALNTPIRADKPWRIGVELEVYARTQDFFNTITRARTNWFMCERDSSLTEASGLGIELKTIPLRACDAKSVDFWAEPMDKLGKLARSKGCPSTGLHVHISKEILGTTEQERQTNLNKLCTFYTYYVEDDPAAHAKNVTICGRQRGYGTGSLDATKTTLSEFSKKIGLNKVGESEAAFTEMAETVKAGYQGQRWDINVGNWNSIGTIEFRKADGRISKTRLAAVCTWWEQMCLYTKETHPKDFSFDRFFEKVCREYPAVAYFFQQDEEQ